MNRAVFIDASGWIAIVNKKDHYHLTAVRLYKQLLQNGVHLITTTWTAYEALSLLKSRFGVDVALKLWEILNNRKIVSLIRISTKIEADALKMFFCYGRFQRRELRCTPAQSTIWQDRVKVAYQSKISLYKIHRFIIG